MRTKTLTLLYVRLNAHKNCNTTVRTLKCAQNCNITVTLRLKNYHHAPLPLLYKVGSKFWQLSHNVNIATDIHIM
jgi:hypothetical protein